MDIEQRRALRSALVSGDGATIVAALTNINIGETAQLIGDALLLAVEQHTDDAELLAQRCVAALRERSWDGDGELAAQLDAALNSALHTPALAALRVDLDDVADLLGSGDSEGGWINLESGDTWQLDTFDTLDDDRPDFDDSDRWLAVPSHGGRSAYRDMENFIAGLTDVAIADQLRIAIDGQGAFRRFKNTIQHSPDVEDAWYEFSNERRRGRARAWLASLGYRPQQRVYRPNDS